MAKVKLRDVRPYVTLYHDEATGIAWVEDGTTGIGHSAHPNIDASGSVEGMKNLGYWDRNARTVESHGFIYNVDARVVSDELDRLADENCRCGGAHPMAVATIQPSHEGRNNLAGDVTVCAHHSSTHDGVNVEIDAPTGTRVTVHINDGRVVDTVVPE